MTEHIQNGRLVQEEVNFVKVHCAKANWPLKKWVGSWYLVEFPRFLIRQRPGISCDFVGGAAGHLIVLLHVVCGDRIVFTDELITHSGQHHDRPDSLLFGTAAVTD